MSSNMNRRELLTGSLGAAAAGAIALRGTNVAPAAETGPADALPSGRIGNLRISRMLLGGNLLTHFTHSRDLRYVYDLAAHYNTDEKILETLAVAEQNGVNTVSMHNPKHPMSLLRKHRKQGGKIQWIICPTARIDEHHMEAYTLQVKELIDDGCEAVYLWGVWGDQLTSQRRVDLIAKAVEIPKKLGVPSGVGCHDLRAVAECEKQQVPADFYIKTFHHHEYPTGPKPEQLKHPCCEIPGYWCKDPQETIELMKKVEKPWIAFKIMAAGAIPPKNAFPYAFNNGADHILVGMFDFEIAKDVEIAKSAVAAAADRPRPWRS
ncbi:MAG: hypothetical protein JW959_14490 [Pirellulales bacterium]|nr:hypothetical protein [Pirellulales bacterium]